MMRRFFRLYRIERRCGVDRYSALRYAWRDAAFLAVTLVLMAGPALAQFPGILPAANNGLPPVAPPAAPNAATSSQMTVSGDGVTWKALSAWMAAIQARESVVDLGAKCNGTGNDTSVFQNAVNSLAGVSVVYVPPGATCLVSSIYVLSNSIIQIDGTVKLLNGQNSAVFTVANGASNVAFIGFGTIDGNRANQTATGSGGAGINSGSSASNVLVRDLTIQNTYNWPLNFVGINGGLVSNVKMVNGGNSVEFAVGSTNCWMVNSSINGINDGAFSFYGGVTYSGLVNSSITGSTVSSGVGVYNDTAQPAASHDILISGNTVFANQTQGINVTTAGTATAQNYNVRIVNNNVYGNDIGATQIGAVLISNAHNVLLSGNQIHNNGNSALTSAGIKLDNTDTNIAIIGNAIFDEGQGGTLGVGINFSNGPVNVTVIGNKIYDDQTTKTMAYAMNATIGSGAQIYDNAVGPTIGTPMNATMAGDTDFIGPLTNGGPITVQQGFSSIYAVSNITSSASVIAQGTANSLLMTGSGAGASVNLSTTGTDSDVSLSLSTKGNGAIFFKSAQSDRTTATSSPTTGFSITVGNNVSTYLITGGSTLASGTVTMPAAPVVNQWLRIATQPAITSLTLSPNTGQTVVGAPTSMAANTSVLYQYIGGTWYRM
jgi:hypothetical protein